MLQGHYEIRTEPGVFQHISTNGSHLQGTVTESGQGFPHLLQEPRAPNLHQSLPENQPQLAQSGTPALGFPHSSQISILLLQGNGTVPKAE